MQLVSNQTEVVGKMSQYKKNKIQQAKSWTKPKAATRTQYEVNGSFLHLTII